MKKPRECAGFPLSSLAVVVVDDATQHLSTAVGDKKFIRGDTSVIQPFHNRDAAHAELGRGWSILGVCHQQQSSVRYAFQWTGLWPLIGVALQEERIHDALAYVREMLETFRQRLPLIMDISLLRAVQAWDQGDPTGALVQLEAAVGLAVEMGYL